MATVPVTCPECGHPGEKQVGQRPTPEGVTWSGSLSCRGCGSAQEEDGRGELPPGWREAILAEEGEWELRAAPADPVALLKVLRDALGLSLEEAGRLKRRLPGPVLQGTRGEMEHLRLRLLEVGQRAEVVVRVEDAP